MTTQETDIAETETANKQQDVGREPEDAAKDESADTPSQGCVRDVERLMYGDAPGNIAKLRCHDGFGAGRDMMKVQVVIPGINRCGDVSEDIEVVYSRNVIGRHGMIERLVEGVDQLCNELDPKDTIELEDAEDDRDAGEETSGDEPEPEVDDEERADEADAERSG